MRRFSVFIFGLLVISQLACNGPVEEIVESQDSPPPAEASASISPPPECSESIPCPEGETCTEGVCVVAVPDVVIPPEVCGDGLVNNNGAEQCDDGNTADGDCCDSTCQFEANGSACDDSNSCTAIDQCDGFGLCSGSGSTCGGGSLEADCGEQCDDSNTFNGDGCDSICQNEFCGDGSVNNNGAEQCDDSNTFNGDGCDSACQNEFCGDGFVNNNGAEQCDDGNNENGDGCQANCLLSACGDNVLDDGESCDDGNLDNFDGCSDVCIPECLGDPSRTVFAGGGPGASACQVFEDDQASCEEAYHLGGSGIASCYFDDGDTWCYGCGPNNENSGNCINTCRVPVCGDGFLGLGEECDDGNLDGEDGCESDCTLTVE